MPLYLGVGLPGPLHYSKRISGGRRSRKSVTAGAPFGGFVTVLIFAVILPVLLFGPYGLLVLLAVLIWVLRSRARERREIRAEYARIDQGWRTYQASLLD